MVQIVEEWGCEYNLEIYLCQLWNWVVRRNPRDSDFYSNCVKELEDVFTAAWWGCEQVICSEKLCRTKFWEREVKWQIVGTLDWNQRDDAKRLNSRHVSQKIWKDGFHLNCLCSQPPDSFFHLGPVLRWFEQGEQFLMLIQCWSNASFASRWKWSKLRSWEISAVSDGRERKR